MKRLTVALLIVVLYILAACGVSKSESPSRSEISEETSLPTVAHTPTQTPAPTQTPLPTVTPMPRDISSVQPLPNDSLDWNLTFDKDYSSPLITWWKDDELFSTIQSNSEAFRSEISCSEQPYREELLRRISEGMLPSDEQPEFGDKSISYYWAGKNEGCAVYFLQENCFVYVTYKGNSSQEYTFQMAQMITDGLTNTTMEKGLAFPSYEVNLQVSAETILFVQPQIDKNSARFKVTISTKKPFIQQTTLAIYDKSNDKFLSRTDYFNRSFLSPTTVIPNEDIQANKITDYQLWVWVEDSLVYTGGFVWEE